MKVEKGYHITRLMFLPNIQKYGLIPCTGKSSLMCNEPFDGLFFTDKIENVLEWKKNLFPETSADKLVLLEFDISNKKYNSRDHSFGDCFLREKIDSKDIKVISVKNSKNNNARGLFQKIENLSNKLQTKNQTENFLFETETTLITNLHFDNNFYKLVNEEMIDELANYEHIKWVVWQKKIHDKGQKNNDGSLSILNKDIQQFINNLKLQFKDTDNIYKKEIFQVVRRTVSLLFSYGIIQDNISNETLINELAIIEHNRRNRWAEYMLNLCDKNAEKITISKNKYDLWEREINTNYYDLNETEKNSDKKEVQIILDSITNIFKNN